MHTVQLGVDRLTAARELTEDGFVDAVALVTLQAGDPPADSLGAVGSSTLGDLGVQGARAPPATSPQQAPSRELTCWRGATRVCATLDAMARPNPAHPPARAAAARRRARRGDLRDHRRRGARPTDLAHGSRGPAVGRDPGTRLFLAAAVVGLLHALPSLYWALGGTALLSTVGAEAEAYRRESPGQATALLLAVVVVKVAGAVVPVLNHQQRLPLPRLWRGIGWAGSGLLVLYGSLYAAVSGAALAGLVGDPDDQDRTALLGHALLWDPLFALWGVLLGLALWRTRPERRGSPLLAAPT